VAWRQVGRVTAVLLALAGAAAIIAGDVQQWREEAQLKAYGIKATAEVERFHGVGRDRTALVRLTAPDGSPLEIWISSVAGDHTEVGDDVKITYDPADTSNFQYGWGASYAGAIVLTLIAAVVVAAASRGVYGLVTGRRLVPDWVQFTRIRLRRRLYHSQPTAPPTRNAAKRKAAQRRKRQRKRRS
jgi:hypothetical protein